MYCNTIDAWTECSKDLSWANPNEFDNKEKAFLLKQMLAILESCIVQARAQFGSATFLVFSTAQ